MTAQAPLTAQDAPLDLAEEMRTIGRAAKAAAAELALAPAAQKNRALTEGAAALRRRQADILRANAQDLSAARSKGLTASMLDRLALSEDRIAAMAAGLDAIAGQADPVGRELARWTEPNGLTIARVSVPLGVIGIIYESRPNVTADAGALCLKSGNAAILRGGSESFHSSGLILDCLQAGLKAAGLPAACLQRPATSNRDSVGHLLRMSDFVDVIVPRGGRGLIERVFNEAKVPVMAHLDGLCHLYLHQAADPKKALEVAFNAKMRRTSVCGAAETLLVDRAVAADLLPLLDRLAAAGCELRGDAAIQALDSRVVAARDADWDREYLEPILSLKTVAGLDEAIAHINRHGSHHTESIITEDAAAAQTFLNRVDAAIVMHNTSTQFADGGEFGMGAEIGISTGKLHARGPVGAAQLTSYKYHVRSDGQTRP